jgi:hypothetical protein
MVCLVIFPAGFDRCYLVKMLYPAINILYSLQDKKGKADIKESNETKVHTIHQ